VLVPNTFRITTPQLGLAVHDWGGDGPPALLAHPTGFHGRVWAPIAERLVGAGRHVWSFDFRGHGDSDAPEATEANYSWRGFATDATAVIDDLGIGGDAELLVAGHSKGAAALLLAEAMRPGVLPRIWAYEPIMFPSDAVAYAPDENALSRSALKRRNIWSSIEEAYEAYASKPPLDVMTPESLRAYVEYGLRERADGTYELKCRPDVEARVYAMAPSNGAWDALPGIASAVAVACGEVSKSIDPALAARIADRLPNSTLEVFANLGHFGPQQDPDACVESMLLKTP
jgi:pimeloyl-ACP methyl ester carboxylesterase